MLALTLGRFVRHRLAVGSAGVVLMLALAALAAPLVEMALATGAETVDLFNRFAAPSAVMVSNRPSCKMCSVNP